MKTTVNEEARRQIRAYFRQLNYLFGVFISGVVLFLITAYIVVYFQGGMNDAYNDFLIVGAPLSGIALILMSYRLFLGRVKQAREREKLYQKMEGYRSGQVLRMVILDGAAFIQLIAYIMSDNKLYLALCLGVMTVFFLSRPTLEKFISDLRLSDVEAQVMRDHANRKKEAGT